MGEARIDLYPWQEKILKKDAEKISKHHKNKKDGFDDIEITQEDSFILIDIQKQILGMFYGEEYTHANSAEQSILREKWQKKFRDDFVEIIKRKRQEKGKPLDVHDRYLLKEIFEKVHNAEYNFPEYLNI